MAYKDGMPDTTFSAQDRAWVKKVAADAGGGGGGGGAGLPEITGADEGKVLTVSNGAAEWMTGPVVFIYVNENDELSLTWNSLRELMDSNIFVVLKNSYSDDTFNSLSMSYVYSTDYTVADGYQVLFLGTEGVFMATCQNADEYPVFTD